MKILQVLLSPRIGGAEALVDSLHREWSSVGLTCETYYLDPTTRQTSGRLRRILSLSLHIKEFRPDVVVSHSALPNIYSRIAAPKGIPVVTVLHSATDDFRARSLRWAERLLRRRTSAVVGVSGPQIDQYIAHFGSTVPTLLIPNGIRPDALPRSDFRQRPEVAATVARVARQKNPHLWVETAQLLSSRRPELNFYWWGPPSLETGLSDVFSQQALKGSKGTYQGPTSDPISVLSASDFLFHTADREAHSVGILEAAAVGLPIICSQTVAATLPRSVVAIPFEDGSAESALGAIEVLLHDWEEYAQSAAQKAAAVLNEFSIKSCAQEYVRIFEEVIAGIDVSGTYLAIE